MGGELRIHNEYLCLQNVENVAQNVAKRHGEASGASCNSCRQTHQLPKIAIPGVIGVVDGQKGGGEGRGRKEGHPQSVSQPACCVAFNFINTFIILCHTEAVAQVAPATRLLPSLSPSASLSLSPASVDGNQSATAGALASHLAPDFWLNVTTAAATQPGCLWRHFNIVLPLPTPRLDPLPALPQAFFEAN